MSTKRLRVFIYAGILSALSFVLMRFVEFPLLPLPQASFLKTDLGDIPLLIAAYFFGPLVGVLATLVKDLLFFISGAGQGGPLGVLMNFIALGTFTLVLGLITLKKKNTTTLLLGLILGTVALVLVMIPANLWAIPQFMPNWGKEETWRYILYINIPFNILKGAIDTLLGFLSIKALEKRNFLK